MPECGGTIDTDGSVVHTSWSLVTSLGALRVLYVGNGGSAGLQAEGGGKRKEEQVEGGGGGRSLEARNGVVVMEIINARGDCRLRLPAR